MDGGSADGSGSRPMSDVGDIPDRPRWLPSDNRPPTWPMVVTRCLVNDNRPPGPMAFTIYVVPTAHTPELAPIAIALYSREWIPPGTNLTLAVDP